MQIEYTRQFLGPNLRSPFPTPHSPFLTLAPHLPSYSPLSIPHSPLCPTLHSPISTPHSPLPHSPILHHSLLSTHHSNLFAPNSPLSHLCMYVYTLHFTLFTLHSISPLSLSHTCYTLPILLSIPHSPPFFTLHSPLPHSPPFITLHSPLSTIHYSPLSHSPSFITIHSPLSTSHYSPLSTTCSPPLSHLPLTHSPPFITLHSPLPPPYSPLSHLHTLLPTLYSIFYSQLPSRQLPTLYSPLPIPISSPFSLLTFHLSCESENCCNSFNFQQLLNIKTKLDKGILYQRGSFGCYDLMAKNTPKCCTM